MPVTKISKVLIIIILLSSIQFLMGQPVKKNKVDYEYFLSRKYEVKDSILQLIIDYKDSTRDSSILSADSSQYFPPKLFNHLSRNNNYMGLFPGHRYKEYSGAIELLYFNAPQNRKQTYSFCEEDSSWFLYKIVVEQYPVLEPSDIKIE